MNNKASSLSPAKKLFGFIKRHKILTAILIFVLLFIITGIVSVLADNAKQARQAEESKPKFEQVDVNGLVVKEACEKLRAKGWTIGSVMGVNNYYQTVDETDCSDMANKVTDVSYYDTSASISFHSDKKYEADDTTNKTDAAKDEEITGGNGTDDETITKIEQSALAGGLCRFKQSPEQVVSVDQVGTSATTEFINMGIKLFKGDTCKSFSYQLAILTDDGRGNQSRNVVLQFSTTKDKFQAYNWQNLEGRVVGTQLQNDGIITMVNTNIGLDPSKFELYALN